METVAEEEEPVPLEMIGEEDDQVQTPFVGEITFDDPELDDMGAVTLKASAVDRKETMMFNSESIHLDLANRIRPNELLKVHTHVLAQFDKEFGRINLTNALLATFSVVCTIVLMEVNFNHDTENKGYSKQAAKGALAQVIKSLTMLSTIALQINLVRLYNKLNAMDGVFYGRDAPLLWQSNRFGVYIVEVLLCLVHAPPFMSYLGFRVVVVDKASIATLARLYLWLRVYRDHSVIYKWRRWVLFSINVLTPDSRSAGLIFDTSLTLKHVYNRHPWKFFGISTVLSVAFFSYGMYIAERIEQPEDFTDPVLVVYFVLVTMTTLGYGDYSPVSVWGRVVAVVTSIWGLALAGLLLITLINFFNFNTTERHVSNLVLKRRYIQKAIQAQTKIESLLQFDEKDAQGGDGYRVTPGAPGMSLDEEQLSNTDIGSQVLCLCCKDSTKAVNTDASLKLLKKMREYESRQRGMITTDDQIAQIASEVSNMYSIVENALTSRGNPEETKLSRVGKKSRMSQSTNLISLTSQSQSSTQYVSTGHSIQEDKRRATEFQRQQSKLIEINREKQPVELLEDQLKDIEKKPETPFDESVNNKLCFDHGLNGMSTHPVDEELASTSETVLRIYDRRLQILNIIQLVISIVVILMAVIMLEDGWEEPDMLLGIEGIYEPTSRTIYFKCVVSFLTVVSVILLYYIYLVRVKYDQVLFKMRREEAPISLWRSNLLWYFVLEFVILILHAPPGGNEIKLEGGDPLIWDKAQGLVWFRLYQVFPVYRDWSDVYKFRRWVIETGEFKRNNPIVRFNAMYSVKALYNENPWAFVSWASFLGMFFFSYCMYIAERTIQSATMSKASDVFYHVAVTMTTVGYGDISPQSFYGRVMAMIATIFGIYLATLLVTAMMISSEFTPNERTASQQVMSRVGKRNIVDESVKLIQCVWAFHVFKKHNRVIETFQTKKKFVFRAVDWNQEYSSRIVNHIRHLNVLFNRFHNNQAADLHANLEKAVLRMGERMRVLTSEVSTLSAHAKKAIAKNPHFFDEAEFVAKIKAQAIAEYKQQEFLNEKNGVVTGVTTSEVHSVNTQNIGEVIRPIEDGQQMEVKVLSPTATVGVESKQTRPSVLDELMPGYTEAYLTPKPSVLDELMPGYTEAYLTPKPASSIQSALKLNTPTAANDAARLSVSNGGFFLPGKKPKPNKK